MRERLQWLTPGDDERLRDWARRLAPYAVVTVVLLALLVGVGAWVYFDSLAYGPTESPAAVESEYDVTVESGYGGYVVRPDDQPPDGERAGLVFYPGGRVEPGSYVHTLAPLAERGVTVVVPGVPLNLAVLDSDAASPVVSNENGIDSWYVGGHSLGGAMACRYANGNADRVDGVVLAASYCDVNVSDSGLATVAITGTRDGVLNRERFEANRRFLPADATFVSVEGMNHAQFGNYGAQDGDGEATISTTTAHERVVAALVDWLCAEGEAVGCEDGGRLGRPAGAELDITAARAVRVGGLDVERSQWAGPDLNRGYSVPNAEGYQATPPARAYKSVLSWVKRFVPPRSTQMPHSAAMPSVVTTANISCNGVPTRV